MRGDSGWVRKGYLAPGCVGADAGEPGWPSLFGRAATSHGPVTEQVTRCQRNRSAGVAVQGAEESQSLQRQRPAP